MTDNNKLEAIRKRIARLEEDEITGFEQTYSAIADVRSIIDLIPSTPSVPDQSKSREEILERFVGSIRAENKHEIWWDDALQAMQTYANQEVSAAVEAKDKEIDRLKAACFACGSKADVLKSDLSAANQTIAELKEYINPSKNIWGADRKEVSEFVKAITKNAGPRD